MNDKKEFLATEPIGKLLFRLSIPMQGIAQGAQPITSYNFGAKNAGRVKKTFRLLLITCLTYSIAPFLGVMFSMILLREKPELQFYIALVIMLVSTYFMVKDTIELQHTHEHEHIHTHEHSHGDTVHTHSHSHIHSHLHVHDGDSENHKHKHTLNEHNHSHSNAEVTP